MLFVSCKKDKKVITVDLGTNYFPREVGSWVIYDVDSIIHDDNDDQAGKIDTIRFKLKEIIESRGHKVEKLKTFPIVISDDIESVTKTKEVIKILDSLNLMQDVNRLKSRRARTGKSSLRGRGTKIGKSVLFVVSNKILLLLKINCNEAKIMAIVNMTIWLLHPFFVSTTLYVIQRMAMLPATFILLGFYIYLTGREIIINNK